MSGDAVAPSSAAQRLVPILENDQIALDTFRLRLADPILARAICPGQFVMIRPGQVHADDPLLGRPFALYDVVVDESGAASAVDVVYQVVGRGTALLAARRPGEKLSIWGPLGNGFGAPPGGSVIFVAGGIGQTPFLSLGRSWLGMMMYGAAADDADLHLPGKTTAYCKSVSLLYGVRTAALLAGVDDFLRAGIDVEIATDDGTTGYHGFVTDLLARRLERGDRVAQIVGCGPVPMLTALARVVKRYDVACDVSLENHMACGFGACFSCVVPIRQADGATDLRRACVEGPVFAAERVDWSAIAH